MIVSVIEFCTRRLKLREVQRVRSLLDRDKFNDITKRNEHIHESKCLSLSIYAKHMVFSAFIV